MAEKMTEMERFKTICRGGKPDYTPVFAFSGAPGVSMGSLRLTHDRLVATGMPDTVRHNDPAGWMQYWGTTTCDRLGFIPVDTGGRGVRSTKRIENGFEIIEYETGAITRQVLDNDITYSMPEFIQYHVRDRASWERYRELTYFGESWDRERVEEACIRHDGRKKPLMINISATWGILRTHMGMEKACTILYDDPELAHDILNYYYNFSRSNISPVIERLRPEILFAGGEDMCYKNGLMISPAQFNEYCAPWFREVGDLAASCDASMVGMDCDGNVTELVSLFEACGGNAISPFEVKAGNDLFAIREQHPRFIMMGGLEKEVLNEGNENMIRSELMSKIPALLEKGRYFPNADHGIQPGVTFQNLCKFMTLLHKLTGNPEGNYPKMDLTDTM